MNESGRRKTFLIDPDGNVVAFGEYIDDHGVRDGYTEIHIENAPELFSTDLSIRNRDGYWVIPHDNPKAVQIREAGGVC